MESKEAKETVADIVAEFREMVHKSVDGIIAVKADVIADRIEAAWNREHGNAAAMREAIRKAIAMILSNVIMGRTKFKPVIDVLESALSSPPRNCDKFGGDEVELFDCYIHERKVCEYKHLFPDYGFWLLKTAERKVESDGK